MPQTFYPTWVYLSNAMHSPVWEKAFLGFDRCGNTSSVGRALTLSRSRGNFQDGDRKRSHKALPTLLFQINKRVTAWFDTWFQNMLVAPNRRSTPQSRWSEVSMCLHTSGRGWWACISMAGSSARPPYCHAHGRSLPHIVCKFTNKCSVYWLRLRHHARHSTFAALNSFQQMFAFLSLRNTQMSQLVEFVPWEGPVYSTRAILCPSCSHGWWFKLTLISRNCLAPVSYHSLD